MAAPAIAVIGLPGLPEALEAAGYRVLGGAATDAASTAAAVRSAAVGSYVVVVAGEDDPSLRQWIALQVARGVAVLVCTSPERTFADIPPGCRTVELPADLDTIMGRFGAPAKGAPAGLVVIGADGMLVLADEPVAPPAPTHVVPPPSPFELEQTALADADGRTPLDTIAPPPAPATSPPRLPRAAPVAAPGAPSPGLPMPPPAPTPPMPPTQPAPVAAEQEPAADRQPPATDLRPPVPTERGWVAPVQRSPIIPESMDPSRLFQPAGAHAATTVATTTPTPTRRAPVVITFSGKGGVGKTATAIAIAQRAATVGGLRRVLLVDANRGQGDVRAYLRLTKAALPSIYDAALAQEPRRAIVPPSELNATRGDMLPPLGIGVVLAPDDAHADPDAVPTAAYRGVVDYARERFDLVVVDTQIVEAVDTSGLIDGLVVPLLLDGAFGVAITDSSMAGVRNVFARLNTLIARGVTRDHLLVAVNRASPDSGLDEEMMRTSSALLATWAGLVLNDPAVGAAFEQGHVPGAAGAPPTPAYTAMLDVVLRRVTGFAVFASEEAAAPRRRGGLFRRRG